MKRVLPMCLIGAVAGVAAEGTASAQAWIGQIAAETARQQSEWSCMGGQRLPPHETAEAKTPAVAMMQDFWARSVAARGGSANGALPAAKWISGAVKSRMSKGHYLSDPMAPSSEFQLIGEPFGFERAGASPNVTAYGVWRVASARDPSATVAYYKAEFLRFMFKWQLQSITALPADAAPQVTPFCNKPGDIEKATARQEERARKKAEKDRG